MLQKRLQAWDIYENTTTPLGRRGDLGTLRLVSNFKFQELVPSVSSASSNGDGGNALSPAIEHSLTEALVDERAGLIVQRNGSVVRTELDEKLRSAGVILTDLETAVREYPDTGAAILHDELRTCESEQIYGFARGLLEWRHLPLHSKGCGDRKADPGTGLD